ncbi:hypothetical protein A1OK_10465 [Enterovibrio norvegicus FF-454]|uniref:Uncharacterized protein n=1 Tax=Enterovibrio norvegicus FF-454 TaxID=1185651 RepID=A0A1E5C561_9GAMM|nr:hypothetical protein [Enterovibrio norvegicus]OEE60615.1 hypothetical protein A1OK_10465 [Enterovibrio norvegicus FF-454]
MSKKFLNKVTAERTVLSALNNHYADLEALEGLTSISIKSWAIKNSISHSDNRVITLLTLSNLCHKMSDRSQESFESIDESVMNEVMITIPSLFE